MQTELLTGQRRVERLSTVDLDNPLSVISCNGITEIVTKIIVLLQNIDGRPTWNLTLVTMAFSLLNVRIDAATGSVTGATKDSLFNLGSRT
jgi:hypothetical protein